MGSEHHIEVVKTARYYTLLPKDEVKSVLFVIHGYRQLAKYFINRFQSLAEKGVMVVAPEGLSRFYIDGYSGRIGASWMTKEDRETDIKDYINYLNKLYVHLDLPAHAPIDILGFSQGGPTACRWLAGSSFVVRNLVLHSTVFPNDFDFIGNSEKLKKSTILTVFGDQDPFAGEATIAAKMEWMNNQGVESKLLRFAGGHDIHDQTLIDILSV